MNHRKIFAAAAASALIGATALFAPAASAGDVAWSVSFGGPGFGITAGEPAYRGYQGGGYRAPYRPYYRPYRPHYRPIVVAPPVVYAPRPIVYAPYYRGYTPAPVYSVPRPWYGYGY